MIRRWPSWSRSLYWRIAVTFVVFSYMTARSSPTFLSPNVLAVTVAADMQDELASDPAFDLQRRLETKYAGAQPLYVILKDGRVGSNSKMPLPDDIRRATDAIGAGGNMSSVLAKIQTNGPIVSAP